LGDSLISFSGKMLTFPLETIGTKDEVKPKLSCPPLYILRAATFRAGPSAGQGVATSWASRASKTYNFSFSFLPEK
jgi:hypothetical protein